MALDVDGMQILKAIAAHPQAFPDIRADVAKTGRALVVRQLKAKSLALAGLRLIRESLGAEPFALVADGLTDAEAKSLVARLDKYHPDIKTAAADWPRRHLMALASGTEPIGKAATEPKSADPKPAAKRKPGSTRALGSAAFTAAWDGKDHDRKPKKKSG